MHQLSLHTNFHVTAWSQCGHAGVYCHYLIILYVLGYSILLYTLCKWWPFCCCQKLVSQMRLKFTHLCLFNRRHRPSWWCWSFWGWPRMWSLSRRCQHSDAATSSRHSPKTWTAFSVSWWQFCTFLSRTIEKRSVEFYHLGCLHIKSGAVSKACGVVRWLCSCEVLCN